MQKHSPVESVKSTRDRFKRCPMCAYLWKDRDAFLSDPMVRTVGYMATLEQVELGLFLFNHGVCGTTMAIRALEFTDMYTGPIFEERLIGTEECPGYCLLKDEIRSCPAKCACAYVRAVLE
jgi:hypothetical protein